MRFLAILLLAAGLAACSVEQGPPVNRNPAPAPAADLPTGQPHSDCPSGLTVC